MASVSYLVLQVVTSVLSLDTRRCSSFQRPWREAPRLSPLAFDNSSESLKRLQLRSLKARGASEAPALGHENHLRTWASPGPTQPLGRAQVQVFELPTWLQWPPRAKGYWLVRHRPYREGPNALKLLHLPGALKADSSAGGHGSLTGE